MKKRYEELVERFVEYTLEVEYDEDRDEFIIATCSYEVAEVLGFEHMFIESKIQPINHNLKECMEHEIELFQSSAYVTLSGMRVDDFYVTFTRCYFKDSDVDIVWAYVH